jgi:WD40 repeat protein
MPDLFISHASADRLAAERLAIQLRARHFESFFLDFDRATGIPVGQDWEKTLYRRLLACSAVVFLCTADSAASKWCFAELAQARALGKQILPIRLAGHALPDILRDVQAIDVAAGADIDDTRLWAELARLGVSEDAGFGWDDTRAPYPGMLAFAERDAAVFFGRRQEVDQLVDVLGRMRLADVRLLVVVGASGSGKSSVVRAGLMPRVKRNRVDWIVLDPTTAGPDLLERLAEEIVAACPRDREPPSYATVDAEIRDAASGSGDLRRAALSSRLRSVRLALDARNAQVLWVVDQAERVLAKDAEMAEARRLIARCALTAGLPLHIVLTLRSDHLDAWQTMAAAESVGFESIPLAPLAPSRFGEVIEGPARLAGLELAPGLVPAMVADASRPDGLPLLAFVLRELWDRFGHAARRITLENYIDGVGRLEGAVGRRAAEVLSELRLSADQLGLLRETMCRMARLGEKDYVAQPIPWGSVPQAVRPALERLIDARLLVTRRDMVEVAHDVLFRAWGELREWLEASRSFLEWRRRLEPQIQAWESHARNIDQFHLSGAPLQEAMAWLASHDASVDEPTRRFVEASAERAQREQARLRQAYQTAHARQLAAQAQVILRVESAELMERGLLLAVESMRRCLELGISTFEADQALRQGLTVAARRVAEHTVSQPIALDALVPHPHQPSVAFGQEDGATASWNFGTGQLESWARLGAAIRVVAFSPDGTMVAVADQGGDCLLIEPAKNEAMRLQPPFAADSIHALAFSPDNRHLAVAFHNRIAVWDLPVSTAPVVIEHPANVTFVSMTFSGDGSVLIAQAIMDDTIGWRWRDTQAVLRVASRGNRVTHSPDGRFLAIGSTTFRALLLDVYTGEWHELADNAARVAFSGDSAFVGIASPEHFARLWTLPGLTETHTLRHNAEVWDLEFSPNGQRVVTGAKNNVAHVWSTATGSEVARMVAREPLRSPRFLANSRHVVTLSGNATLTLWDTEELSEIRMLRHQVAVLGVAFAPDGKTVATNARISQVERAPALIDLVAQRAVPSVRLEDGREISGAEYAGQLLGRHDACSRKEAASPNGDLVAVADGPVVRVLRGGPEGELVATLRHERTVFRMVFSPDGRFLATASDHDTARIWEVSTGQEVSRLTHADPNVVDVDWSPNGRHLATASWDHTARVWLWRPQDLVDAASTRLGRNLSAEEWQQYLPEEPYRQTFAR